MKFLVTLVAGLSLASALALPAEPKALAVLVQKTKRGLIRVAELPEQGDRTKQFNGLGYDSGHAYEYTGTDKARNGHYIAWDEKHNRW